MIYKYISKKCFELPLQDQFKQTCVQIIQKYASKKNNRLEELSKTDIIIKICQKLIKFIENIRESSIDDGLKLLQFIKGLTMQIYQNNRIEAYLIKIRAYLLTIRWNKVKNIPIDKLIPRVILFVDQIKAKSIYEAISSDYYSQLERLYLEVIEYTIKNNKLDQSIKLICNCFQSFKSQIGILCSLFNIDDNKVNRLINIKLQLLAILFKFEHGVRFITNIYSPQEITAQIQPKYERITLKIPITHFPTPHLVADTESVWFNNRTINTIRRQVSVSTLKQSVSRTVSKFNLNLTKQKSRESLRQTIQYLNDFFKKRSNSAAQLQSQQPQLQQKKIERLPEVKKKSFFQLQNKQKENCLQPKDNLPKGIRNSSKSKNGNCQPVEMKKFKLMINMERQARDKILRDNPFKTMNKDQLSMLTLSKGLGHSLVFYQ